MTRELLGDARYASGAPVIRGPFGGDDLMPGERRMLAAWAARKAKKRWWKPWTWSL